MVEVDNSTIGGRIRECRKKLGWSQDNLAAEMKSSKALISEYETGKTNVPNDKLVEMAKILKTEGGYLLNGEITFRNEDENLNLINFWYKSLDNESDKEFLFFQVQTTMKWIQKKSRKA